LPEHFSTETDSQNRLQEKINLIRARKTIPISPSSSTSPSPRPDSGSKLSSSGYLSSMFSSSKVDDGSGKEDDTSADKLARDRFYKTPISAEIFLDKF
jgi:hypothetical protein